MQNLRDLCWVQQACQAAPKNNALRQRRPFGGDLASSIFGGIEAPDPNRNLVLTITSTFKPKPRLNPNHRKTCLFRPIDCLGY